MPGPNTWLNMSMTPCGACACRCFGVLFKSRNDCVNPISDTCVKRGVCFDPRPSKCKSSFNYFNTMQAGVVWGAGRQNGERSFYPLEAQFPTVRQTRELSWQNSGTGFLKSGGLMVQLIIIKGHACPSSLGLFADKTFMSVYGWVPGLCLLT